MVTTNALAKPPDPQLAALVASQRFGGNLVRTTGNWRGGTTDTGHVNKPGHALGAIGFRPDVTADRTAIRLHHCPFHELARDSPTSCAASIAG